MKRKFGAIVLLLATLLMVGCATHVHTIGQGGSGGQMLQERQWYILWGLVPLNDVSTDAMSGGAADYTIQTQTSFLDGVINIFTGFITVNSRTVTVTK